MRQQNEIKTFPNLKAVFFDMDGTLFSSEPVLHQAYQKAVASFNEANNNNIPVPELEDILHYVGQPASVIFAGLFPQLSEEQRRELNQYSLANLCTAIEQGGGILYEGVKPLLSQIQKNGLATFVASNGRQNYLEAIIQGFNLQEYFPELITIESKGVSSKAEIILNTIAQKNLSQEEAVMVGDRDSDINAARHANIPFIGVTWGHGVVAEIEQADLMAHSPQELTKYLLG